MSRLAQDLDVHQSIVRERTIASINRDVPRNTRRYTPRAYIVNQREGTCTAIRGSSSADQRDDVVPDIVVSSHGCSPKIPTCVSPARDESPPSEVAEIGTHWSKHDPCPYYQ